MGITKMTIAKGTKPLLMGERKWSHQNQNYIEQAFKWLGPMSTQLLHSELSCLATGFPAVSHEGFRLAQHIVDCSGLWESIVDCRSRLWWSACWYTSGISVCCIFCVMYCNWLPRLCSVGLANFVVSIVDNLVQAEQLSWTAVSKPTDACVSEFGKNIWN